MGSVLIPINDDSEEIRPTINSAGQTAVDIMTSMLGFAEDAYARAIGLTYDVPAVNIPTGILPPYESDPIDFSNAMDALDRLLANLPGLPDFGSITTTTANLSDEIDTNPPDMYPVDIPDFTGEMPTLELPDTPDWESYTPPEEPSVDTSISAPDRPDITIPDEPNLADITIPDPYSVDFPTFDETLVDDNLVAPSNTFAFNEEAYESTILEAVKSGLLDMLQNGDYGLDATDEDRLFNRERDRELQGMSLESEEVARRFSLTGFPMPTGALQKAVERARQKVTDKISSVNRDIAVKKADLYWEGKKFTYSQAIELEKVLIDLHNSIWERTLNAAKAQIQVSIDIFNASVSLANIRQERYKTLAAVFQTRVQAELGKIEAYKAMLEGTKIRVEVNDSLVRLYTARLEGVRTLADVYKTDVEASKIYAELEKLKIDIFKAQVEAFVAQTQGKAAEFEAYRAAVQGEATKAEAYRAQAQAYAAHVDGLKAKIDSNRLMIEAWMQKNQALINVYDAESKVYSDIRASELDVIRAQTDSYRAHVTAFDAEANAVVKVFGLESEQKRAEYQARLLALQGNVEILKARLEAAIRPAELAVATLQAKGQVYTALASAALSAMNVNATLSDTWSGSLSSSWNQSSQDIESTSYSHSDNHNVTHYYHYDRT